MRKLEDTGMVCEHCGRHLRLENAGDPVLAWDTLEQEAGGYSGEVFAHAACLGAWMLARGPMWIGHTQVEAEVPQPEAEPETLGAMDRPLELGDGYTAEFRSEAPNGRRPWELKHQGGHDGWYVSALAAMDEVQARRQQP